MATIPCAGRSLLRQSPHLLRRGAGGKAFVPPRGLHSLVHRPAAVPPSSSMAACAVPSSRHMSTWSCEKETRKKLALEILKTHTWYSLPADKEIGTLDELLHLINSNADPKETERRLRLLRDEMEKKKQELAIALLKEDGTEKECTQRKEELAAVIHRLRLALSPYPLGPELRELKGKYKSLEERYDQLVSWVSLGGIPVAIATFMTFYR